MTKSTIFQLYWLLLNTSYVMEFFLQALVKKRYIKQKFMLFLQKILMSASTIAALFVLQYCNFYICLLSVILNFTTRILFTPYHDVINILIIISIYYYYYYYSFDNLKN